jgi:hypothetical protein
MLAPEVQATTIEVRVTPALDKSQCREKFWGKAMWGRVPTNVVWIISI